MGKGGIPPSETTDVQGRRTGLVRRVGQPPRVGGPTGLHRGVLCGPRRFGALGNDSPSQPGCLPPPIGPHEAGSEEEPRGSLTAATGRRGAMPPLGTEASNCRSGCLLG